jgi:tryptophan-rich sensory protein
VLVIGMDGAPQLGRDFGGVLASVPGFLLLAMLLTRTRVTVTRLLAILGAAVVAVGTVAYLDWLRPADQRTHLGRFVDQLLSGEAWTVVSRKAQANLDILLGSSLAWMLPVALVAAWWLVRPRAGLLRGGAPGGLSRPHTAGLRAGLLAVALSLTLGAAVNDSGVAVPATAAALLVPLLVWLAAAPREDGDVADGTASSGRDADVHRVTVVSRGSTVSNA